MSVALGTSLWRIQLHSAFVDTKALPEASGGINGYRLSFSNLHEPISYNTLTLGIAYSGSER